MKKCIWTGIAVVMLAMPAWGDLVTVNAFGFGAGGYSLFGENNERGGEFRVTATNLGGFNTFCLETNELIGVGNIYNFSLSDRSINGGNGGGHPDPLSPQSAFLYYHYWRGDLDNLVPGYSYTNNTAADALQYAFWFLEDEVRIVNRNTLADDLIAFANTTTWTDIGPVRVMNLTSRVNGANRQDLLTLVPAPGAILLGAIGVSFVGWVKRRLA